jgi:hypothetical protein
MKATKHALRHSKNNPLLFIFVLITFAIAGYFLIASKAAPNPPNVYLTPPSQTMAVNTTFTVQVRETSGATAVNSVAANFSYNASLVDFVSFSTTGSAFPTDISTTNTSGQISITKGTACTTTCTSVTGDQLVATVTFKTKTVGGVVNMAFTTGTGLASATTNQDILGGLANTTGGTFTIDTTPPSVSVSPANGATVGGGGNVVITVTATDTQSSVSSVDVFIDGSCATNTGKVATLTTSPYTYTWNTAPPVLLGAHKIEAKATDSSGNSVCSAVSNITLADQTAPSAPGALTAPSSTTTTINLSWTASTDNAGGTGVAGYKVSRNGTLLTTTPLSSSTLTYVDTGLTAATSYTYTVVAIDGAGNVSNPATLTTPTQQLVPGDANGDGHVSQADLTILAANFGTSASFCDFNHDGIVNFLDVSILLSHYGT